MHPTGGHTEDVLSGAGLPARGLPARTRGRRAAARTRSGREGQVNHPHSPHLMEGRCLMTTSRAWIVSKGTLGSRPESASCSACRLTQDTHLMDTLKMRSFPSPGSVTSSSTCKGPGAHGDSCCPGGHSGGQLPEHSGFGQLGRPLSEHTVEGHARPSCPPAVTTRTGTSPCRSPSALPTRPAARTPSCLTAPNWARPGPREPIAGRGTGASDGGCQAPT